MSRLPRPRPRPTFTAAGGVLAVALTCFYVLHSNAIVASLVLLLTVLLTGIYASLTEAVLASFLATLLLDYFFIPPIKQIAIGDPQGWVALSVFLAVSLITTNLSTSLRRQRDALHYRQQEAEKLHALSRAMLFSTREDTRRLMVNKCVELFGFEEATLFETATGQVYSTHAHGAITREQLARVAMCGSIQELAATGATILPVALGNKNFGSLGVRGLTLSEATLQALGNTMATGLAQAQAQEAASRADAVRKGEELKSVMLDALAHDLKTPLTVIEAATDMLLNATTLSKEQQQDLLQVIHQEEQGLKHRVDEAIHLARIDAKRLQLETESVRPCELINEAFAAMGDRAASHVIQVDCSSSLQPVQVDRELVEEAIKQLLDNAVKYSPAGSTINLSATQGNGMLAIAVRDHGPGLTEIEQSKVFDKFYRGRYDRSAVQGTGMGLAIAKEILQAHGGNVTVESQVGQGSLFTVLLHSAEEAPAAVDVAALSHASSAEK